MSPTVAVIGASTDPAKFGNKSVRAHLRQGWIVYPVNPAGRPIEGLKTYRSILDIPGPVDRVTLYLQRDAALSVLPEIQKKGVGELYLNPGADDPDVVAEAQRLGLRPIIACSIVAIGERP